MSFRLAAVITCSVWAAGGCHGDDGGGMALPDAPMMPDVPDDQAALQALLHDGPLPSLPVADPPVSTVAPVGAGDAVVGAWSFDDCGSARANLVDSTRFANTAFRSSGVRCVPGIHRTGVAVTAAQDIIYVPDRAGFTLEHGITVAGWFNPASIEGTRTLVRKRDGETSSFALVLHAGKFQLIVGLGPDHAISVSAPASAQAGVFQHVVGSYDGATLRLYVDGVDVASVAAVGAIPSGTGPLLIGNDGLQRQFDGTIDNATFATQALPADAVVALTCVPVLPTLETSPSQLGPVAPGVPVTIDVAVTNHASASCGPLTFRMIDFPSLPTGREITLDPLPSAVVESEPVPSGATAHFAVTATATELAVPDRLRSVDLEVVEATTGFDAFVPTPFRLAEPPGCQVDTTRELMITDLSVVEDPVRTVFDPASGDSRNGSWTFKHLVESMAPTPADAPAMVEAMLNRFVTPQTVNSFAVAARPGMQSLILDQWPRTGDGKLDLGRAPMRLLAIVNRFDLRDLAHGDAGEGRFVFAFVSPNGNSALSATMIFEYKLPAATDQDVRDWAQAFHALGARPFGEGYNAALAAITERFAGRGARPGAPNASAINAVRTDEISFAGDGRWELRQFKLSAASGLLEPAPVELTPDGGFNASATLAAYINANQAAIITETHTVPSVFAQQPFQAGAIFNELDSWFAPGVDPSARHHFALNTCNGCHSTTETGTAFLQIAPRSRGRTSALSPFLTGITIPDPVTGESRTFADLARRNADLRAIVCADAGAARSAAALTTLRKGIDRVH
jgi:hypothetical protein